MKITQVAAKDVPQPAPPPGRAGLGKYEPVRREILECPPGNAVRVATESKAQAKTMQTSLHGGTRRPSNSLYGLALHTRVVGSTLYVWKLDGEGRRG